MTSVKHHQETSRPRPVFKALLIGHEHVQQLAKTTQQNNEPNLSSDHFTVFFHSKEKMTLKDIGAELFLLDCIKPHLVLLDVGSYDLAKKNWDADKVLKNMWKLAVYIRTHFKVLRVVICDIYPRTHTEKSPICDNFSVKCNRYNEELGIKCKSSEMHNGFPIITRLKHEGVHTDCREFLGDDGFTLKANGVLKHLQSVKSCLRWALGPLAADLNITLPSNSSTTTEHV